jgi:hypothetical protein
MKTHLLSVKEQQKTTKDVENFIFGAYAWLFTNFSLKVALRCSFSAYSINFSNQMNGNIAFSPVTSHSNVSDINKNLRRTYIFIQRNCIWSKSDSAL